MTHTDTNATFAAITKNITEGRTPIMGLGSMTVVKALEAHGMPVDVTKPCEAALQVRLAGYLAAGKAEKSAGVKSTTKALTHFTFTPDVPGGEFATLFTADPLAGLPADGKPKAPSRKTKADLVAELAELHAFVAMLTNK
tara:strand:+ start:285 stop:704 length:420 start_codon:yes stop_codon:yes gene_type:complete